MTKTGRASPGVGRGGIGDNSGLASYDVITKALAVETIDKEEIAKLNELRKRHRKSAEGNGVALAELDDLYRHKDDPIRDIIDMIKRKVHYFGAVFVPLRKQLDLLMQASESPEMQHAARHAGRMAGLKGANAQPPPNLSGEDLQLWQEGYNDGSKARAEASKERKAELADIMAQALKNAEEGKVTDGTGKAGPGAPAVPEPSGRDPKAQAIGDQAAKDFALDNPETRVGDEVIPPQPDWSSYPLDETLVWSLEQSKAFERWYDVVPATASPVIDHPLVLAQFNNARSPDGPFATGPEAQAQDEPAAEVEVKDDPENDGEGEAPAALTGAAPEGVLYMLLSDRPFATGRQATYKNGKPFSTSVPGKLPVYESHPSFEMTEAELAAQNTRKAIKERQAADTPDPDQVAAEAKKLEESGFAPAKRKRRLPGESTPT